MAKIFSFLLAIGSVTLGLTNIYPLGGLQQECTPVVFSKMEGIAWVKECLIEHPEITWLAGRDVRKTEEGQASDQGSYSEQLFGEKFIEFDRTLMTLHCLRVLLDGSDEAYKRFVAAQPQHVRLSRESFRNLHKQGQELLQSRWGQLSKSSMAQAMETALVLGDIGKSGKARELFAPYNVTAPDHDNFYGDAMQVLVQHPHLCPSFAALPETSRELLAKVANLAHYGHITHLEGWSSMFDKLRDSSIPAHDPTALSFDLFVHTCDVSGALGHVNHNSSIVYTEFVHKAMQAMNTSVRTLSNPQATSADAYRTYLNTRASWLGLDTNTDIDRVLARIGAMLRLYTLEEGAMLRNGVASLSTLDREKMVTELDVQQSHGIPRTPTYMPAVLVNLANNSQLGTTQKERLTQAIRLGLPFLCRALALHRTQIENGQADPNIPLNFNGIAGIAKTSPERLTQECSIDRAGNVSLSAL